MSTQFLERHRDEHFDALGKLRGVKRHVAGVQSRRAAGSEPEVRRFHIRLGLLEVVEVFSAATAVGSQFVRSELFLDGLRHLGDEIFVVDGCRNNAAREFDRRFGSDA